MNIKTMYDIISVYRDSTEENSIEAIHFPYVAIVFTLCGMNPCPSPERVNDFYNSGRGRHGHQYHAFSFS